jgi:hypothetical protein
MLHVPTEACSKPLQLHSNAHTSLILRISRSSNMIHRLGSLAGALLVSMAAAQCSPSQFETNQECIDECGETFVYQFASCPTRMGCVSHASASDCARERDADCIGMQELVSACTNQPQVVFFPCSDCSVGPDADCPVEVSGIVDYLEALCANGCSGSPAPYDCTLPSPRHASMLTHRLLCARYSSWCDVTPAAFGAIGYE